MGSTTRTVAGGRYECAGGRVRFSEAARVAALEHVAASGGSLKQAARELGVGYETLRRWRGEVRGRRLRPVQVVEPPPSRQVVLVLPCGARIEGLDIEAVADLARRLA